MDQQITLIADIDPMMDDVNILARCISIWKSHPKGRPNETWGLETVLQDPEGNRIQASIKTSEMKKFIAILDEGSCYKISNFGVGENGGKFPLLSHRFKISFFKNTAVTRVNSFNNNVRGFCFEPFQNFHLKAFGERDMVDVIGTVVSISEPLPFESYGKEKIRRTVLLQDVDGGKLECCFFDDWADKFKPFADKSESSKPVVIILQLARVKYFNKKPSVSPAVFATKIHIDADLPEIHAFRKRYQEVDGYDASKHAISIITPGKKQLTSDELFSGAIKKMVGSIRESAWEYECLVYGKVHKIHQEFGWTYIDCKRCGRIAKPVDDDEDASASKKFGQSSSKAGKSKTQLWSCKDHKYMTHVGPKYKVIVRVIDDTGSASLLLFDDMINTLVGVPCYKMKEKYGPGAEDSFPEELINGIVGKKLLFRFTYTDWNINNNHHVYQVTKMSIDAEMIKFFKKDFITEDDDDVLETPVASSGSNLASTTHPRIVETVPFNLEETPKGKAAVHSSEDGSGSSGKRTVIDLDDFDELEYDTRMSKRPLIQVKLEKE